MRPITGSSRSASSGCVDGAVDRGVEHARQSRMPHSLLHRELHRHQQRDGRLRPRVSPRSPHRAREAQARRPSPVFVAHNARFDYGFLRAEFRRAGHVFLRPVLCTVKLSRRLFPVAAAAQSRRGDGAPRARVQRAPPRARRCAGDPRFLAHAVPRLSRGDSRRGGAYGAMGRVKLPPHLPEGLADELPEGPGMYRFFGEREGGEVLLYVGRAEARCARPSSVISPKAACGRGAGASAAGQGPGEGAARRVGGDRRRARRLAPRARSAEGTRHRSTTGTSRTAERSVTLKLAEGSSAVAISPIDELEPVELEDCFGDISRAERCAQGARRDRSRPRLCLKILGSRGERRLVPRPSARPLQGCLRRQGAARPARRARADGPGILEAQGLAISRDAWRCASAAHSAPRCCTFSIAGPISARRTARRSSRPSPSAPARAPFDPQLYKLLVRYFANQPKLDWHRPRGAAPADPGRADPSITARSMCSERRA